MTERIPMCWKCSSKITEPTGENSSTLAGCKECNDIKNYEDAKKMCPILKEMETDDGKTD